MLNCLRARVGLGRVVPNAPSSADLPPSRSASKSQQKNGMGASVRGLRRVSSFKSISTLLLMAGRQDTSINVLRTSLLEMHERVQFKWVLHPLSVWKTLWDLMSALVVIFYSWMIPFMLCFDWYVLPYNMKIFLKVLDVWGFLDIALRFRTGIIEYGAIRMNPIDIRKAYMHSIWFPIDIASTFPFEYFLPDPTNAGTRKTIKMIKYIKLPRLLRIGRFFKVVRKYKRYSSMVISLNVLLFVAHVAGCIWVALLSPCEGDELMAEERCRRGGEMKMYWIAFHHGIVSLLGISANHIESAEQLLSGAYHKSSHAVNAEVYVWGSVVSVLGAIITASLYGTIINLVQSWNRAENAFRKKMDQISHEMDALSLPKQLRARVTAYYDYLWLNNRTFSDELNLLKDEGMSLSLRQQIAIYLFKDHLQKVPFFQLASDAVLGMICMQLHQVIFMPDDYIIREGDIGRELFLIIKGIIQVMPLQSAAPTDAKKILLGEGDFFGEIAVVMEVERTRSVRSECVSELCLLSRDGFDKILAEFPEFATAMKRLIIKRVSEMWRSEGKDANSIEKMTLLADYQMKKKIATYNHVRKLRSTAKVIQTITPRLSKVVKSPVTAEVLGMDETELADLQRKALSGDATPRTNSLEEATAQLEVICEGEQDSDEAEGSRPSTGDRIPLRVRPGPRIEHEISNTGSRTPRSPRQGLGYQDYGAADGLDVANDRSGRIGQIDTRLIALEQKLDNHMRQVDTKVGQILDALGLLLSRPPDRSGHTRPSSMKREVPVIPQTVHNIPGHAHGAPITLPPVDHTDTSIQ